jgi:hypothetical protein
LFYSQGTDHLPYDANCQLNTSRWEVLSYMNRVEIMMQLKW